MFSFWLFIKCVNSAAALAVVVGTCLVSQISLEISLLAISSAEFGLAVREFSENFL
jgi:hypothetical protein